MQSRDYDIGIALSDAFQLIKKKPGWMIAWGAIVLLLPLLPVIPMFIWMAENSDVWMNDPDALDSSFGQSLLAQSSSVFQLLVAIPVLAAASRFVLGKQRKTLFAGLAFSMDEVWTFVAVVAAYIGMIIVIMIVGIVAFVSGGLLYAAGQTVVGVLTGIFVAIVLCLPIIWGSVRLSLLIPASVDLNTFAFIPAWNASKGRFWPLFGTWFIAVLLSIGLSILLGVILVILVVIVIGAGFALGWAGPGGPETWNWIPLALSAVAMMIVPLMWTYGATYSLYITPFASAWRQLKPNDTATATVIAEPTEIQG